MYSLYSSQAWYASSRLWSYMHVNANIYCIFGLFLEAVLQHVFGYYDQVALVRSSLSLKVK